MVVRTRLKAVNLDDVRRGCRGVKSASSYLTSIQLDLQTMSVLCSVV